MCLASAPRQDGAANFLRAAPTLRAPSLRTFAGRRPLVCTMFGGSKPKFDANKTKVNLKMLINRFNLLTQKKANLAKQQKREIALLLRDDKEANARILVEHIIREDYTLESYDLLRQYTELLLARLNVVIQEPELKPEVAEAVCPNPNLTRSRARTYP